MSAASSNKNSPGFGPSRGRRMSMMDMQKLSLDDLVLTPTEIAEFKVCCVHLPCACTISVCTFECLCIREQGCIEKENLTAHAFVVRMSVGMTILIGRISNTFVSSMYFIITPHPLPFIIHPPHPAIRARAPFTVRKRLRSSMWTVGAPFRTKN